MLEAVARTVVYPLWDLKDRSDRLAQYRSLLDSQWCSAAQLEALRVRRLNEILAHSYAQCSFYESLWGKVPKLASIAELAQLPLVSKKMVRDNLDAIIARSPGREQLIEAKTGGSTGTALKVYFDERCQQWRNAAALRSDGWAGWRAGMLVAALWGTPPVPKTLKERLRNALHDRLFFLDTMNLNPETMRDFALQLRRRRPGGLFGHAHSLFVFARFLEESREEVPALQAIIATSMMLLEAERHVIERVFRCKVTNRYGCEEVGLIACECERHDGLHVNAEHVIVEIVRGDGTACAAEEEGQIVVTDLVNRGMPLIRYAIEDMGVWSARQCACGRQLPLIEQLVGRRADFLKRRDGSLVAGVSLVEKTVTAIAGIEQMQIVQSELDRFELNVVPAGDFGGAAQAELEGVLREVFGADVHLEVRTMQRLPQERNGKYRFAICRVQESERA